MITYNKGNLLDDSAEALVNTVNTKGVMGKGIALAFKQAFPFNFSVYRYACKIGTCAIGQLVTVQDSNLIYGTKMIINFPTKMDWRKPSEYGYIEKGLKALKILLEISPMKSMAMPALGCGNGGLEWKVVKVMIENELGELNIDVRVYEPG